MNELERRPTTLFPSPSPSPSPSLASSISSSSSSSSPASVVHDAYRRLTPAQLHLFCTARSLNASGSPPELAARLAHYDLSHFLFPEPADAGAASGDGASVGVDGCDPPLYAPPSPSPSPHLGPKAAASPIPSPPPAPQHTHPEPSLPPPVTTDVTSYTPNASTTVISTLPPTTPSRAQLPIEIMADILDHVGDWELSRALGLPTSLPPPLPWTRASPTDLLLLPGRLTPSLLTADLSSNPPTSTGATALVRLSYVLTLDWLFTSHLPTFKRLFTAELIPVIAMHHARIQVLDWWLHAHRSSPQDVPLPPPSAIADAIDRAGSALALAWWRDAGLPFHYTDAALENASAKAKLDILEWWRSSASPSPSSSASGPGNSNKPLPLKVGRVMDAASSAGAVRALEWWATSGLDFTYDRLALYHASCSGRIDVLRWWLRSGMQLFFDGDALVGATRHNRPEVLQWWDESGLPVMYRMCDVEEALEDAIGGGGEAREWWKAKGVDFRADDGVWMRLVGLNSSGGGGGKAKVKGEGK